MMRLATEAGALSYVTKSTVSTDLLKVLRSLNDSASTSSDVSMAANGGSSKKASHVPQDGAQESSSTDEGSVPSAIETLDGRRTQELESAAEQLRDLSGRVLRAQDEERRRIARELHDGVGQLLTALRMNLDAVNKERDALKVNAKRALDDSIDLTEEALADIRTMSYLLHPPMLDEVGLESALHWYAEGFTERSKIAVQLNIDRNFDERLPRDAALALFRIVQECLTNVHRHSESKAAVVTITRSFDRITLDVQDRGKGIPAHVQSKLSSGASVGVGLRGMKERIRQFGGRIDVNSGPFGTQVRAELPLFWETEERMDSAVAGKDPANHEANQSVATVLCIDDENIGLMSRRLLLESAGYQVIEARSGPDGIQVFQSHKVDIVILDYWMSGMKGTAIAAEFKRTHPAIPIIVLSGMSELPGEATGLIDQWLVKGHHGPEHLLDSIGKLLGRQPV